MEQQNILSLSLKEYREQIDSLKEALSKLNEDIVRGKRFTRCFNLDIK